MPTPEASLARERGLTPWLFSASSCRVEMTRMIYTLSLLTWERSHNRDRGGHTRHLARMEASVRSHRRLIGGLRFGSAPRHHIAERSSAIDGRFVARRHRHTRGRARGRDSIEQIGRLLVLGMCVDGPSNAARVGPGGPLPRISSCVEPCALSEHRVERYCKRSHPRTWIAEETP